MGISSIRSRGIERRVRGQATSDGAGVRLTRLLGPELQRRLDPFLLLDAFGSNSPDDYIAGFPDHPHRGFETVTVMLAGRMRHRDSTGGSGLLETGGVQWMTAGRGIIHSEMPEQKEGRMAGFQLWLNLPAADKMCPAGYRDIAAADIPVFEASGGVKVRIVAGIVEGVVGAVTRPFTEPLVLDIDLPVGTGFAISLKPQANAFVVPYAGRVQVGDDPLPLGEMDLAVLDNAEGSEGVSVATNGRPAKVLLVAGRPLGEPIVQHGPFVMNTPEEIRQAIDDYRNGRLTAS
jgi:redox-sensitive bicupin YhaK (pirin superfamily)